MQATKWISFQILTILALCISNISCLSCIKCEIDGCDTATVSSNPKKVDCRPGQTLCVVVRIEEPKPTGPPAVSFMRGCTNTISQDQFPTPEKRWTYFYCGWNGCNKNDGKPHEGFWKNLPMGYPDEEKPTTPSKTQRTTTRMTHPTTTTTTATTTTTSTTTTPKPTTTTPAPTTTTTTPTTTIRIPKITTMVPAITTAAEYLPQYPYQKTAGPGYKIRKPKSSPTYPSSTSQAPLPERSDSEQYTRRRGDQPPDLDVQAAPEEVPSPYNPVSTFQDPLLEPSDSDNYPPRRADQLPYLDPLAAPEEVPSPYNPVSTFQDPLPERSDSDYYPPRRVDQRPYLDALAAPGEGPYPNTMRTEDNYGTAVQGGIAQMQMSGCRVPEPKSLLAAIVIVVSVVMNYIQAH